MKFQFKKRENPIMISSEFFFETKVVYNPDGIQVALAKSSDLIHWEKMGPIKMMLTGWCAEKIKAPVLAPVKVNNKYILYFLGQKRGWHTAIGVAYSEDLLHWEEDRRLPIEPGMQCLTERIQENC